MSQNIDAAKVALTMEAILQNKKTLTFLLVGRTGVGKSSTINSLLGEKVAPVGKHEPTTMEVQSYSYIHNGFPYNIIDTPGLCDDLPEVGNDERYLASIKECAKTADCVWFVTELDATRVTSDEKRGIKLITEALGQEVWMRSIIIFTYADKVSPAEFDSDLSARTRILRAEIGKYFPAAAGIPAVAVSNSSPTLPNGGKWLGELFTQTFIRFSDQGAIPFLASMSKDIGADREQSSPKSQAHENFKRKYFDDKSTYEKESGSPKEPQPNKYEQKSNEAKPRIEINEQQKEKIRESAWKRIVAGATAGATIGEKIGKNFGKVGSAVGASVGALVGAIGGWLFN